ncbi:MAG: HutD family protein [Firmicutes bacterium]|jgi:environmental stress-induced protein Ves|nr:HutD family protein [Bacillota bacterium]
MIECILKRHDQQPVCKWFGGVTRQFAIYPEGREGATAFDYDFEITSSTMDYPETEYTIYEGYDRILMIIDGKVTLNHGDGSVADLKKYDYDMFAGNMKTSSKGIATDYEMMISEENKGLIRIFESDSEKAIVDIKKDMDYELTYCGFYCDGDDCLIAVNEQRFRLSHGDHISIITSEEAACIIEENSGVIINSVIYFNPRK